MSVQLLNVQAVAVCASEAKLGGAYIAAVTEPAPALPEIADAEEETELAEEAPIAPPGQPLQILYTLQPVDMQCTLWRLVANAKPVGSCAVRRHMLAAWLVVQCRSSTDSASFKMSLVYVLQVFSDFVSNTTAHLLGSTCDNHGHADSC